MPNPRIHGGPPFRVAVVHGGPGAGGEMAPVACRLAAHRGVLEPIQTARSVDGQVLELHEILARHARLPVTLIGFSWGAWLAIVVAARSHLLVGKLILVGCGALEEPYVAGLRERRLARLSGGEQEEFESLAAALESPETGDKDHLLARLGQLASKTDQYDAMDDDPLSPSGEIYQCVWPEAALLRRSGELLRLALSVRCPLTVIHGAFDPSPMSGVIEPLAPLTPRVHLLDRCGHKPWIERHARERFFEILEQELESG